MTKNITDRKSGTSGLGHTAEPSQLPRWRYRTPNGYEGHVQAASDDDAYNLVTELTQRSPSLLRRVA